MGLLKLCLAVYSENIFILKSKWKCYKTRLHNRIMAVFLACKYMRSRKCILRVFAYVLNCFPTQFSAAVHPGM